MSGQGRMLELNVYAKFEMQFKYAKKNLPTFHEGYDVDFNK